MILVYLKYLIFYYFIVICFYWGKNKIIILANSKATIINLLNMIFMKGKYMKLF